MSVRQCPICWTMGSLSPSHRRDSHETFLAVVMPFIYPYRCSSCNWRGMMGRAPIGRHRKINIAFNAVVYILFLALVIYCLVMLRERLHPS